MATIIKYRERIEAVDRYHSFKRNDDTTCGWSFPVDEKGNLIVGNDSIQGNYDEVIKMVAKGTAIDEGIKECDASYYEPAVCQCPCGAKVTLDDHWVNGCNKCGNEFNMSGQLLAPREQWGEETGEVF